MITSFFIVGGWLKVQPITTNLPRDRQILDIDLQCLTDVFLAAGWGLLSIRTVKSTARQESENRCFLLEKFARADLTLRRIESIFAADLR
jgi:hypothetical protein